MLILATNSLYQNQVKYKINNFLGPHKLHGSSSIPVRKEGRDNLDDFTFSFSSEEDAATIILPLLHLGKLTQEKKHKKNQDKTSPWTASSGKFSPEKNFFVHCWKVKVKMSVAQLSRTLCDLMDCSPRGSFVHGILQARILEWVEPFRSPGAVSDPGIEPGSPVLQVDSLPLEPPGNRYRTHQDTEDARRAVQAV